MANQNFDMNIYKRPAELLQKLITFDTTNPPGNEVDCIKYIEKLLKQAGIETTILAKDPLRPNLVARLKGQGSAPPPAALRPCRCGNYRQPGLAAPPFRRENRRRFCLGARRLRYEKRYRYDGERLYQG
jgi:acetylornithine deacetylase/succinyl-diaminopimelate desuccinylase-like protein